METPVKKFSYSKLNIYENCAWRYKLTYEDGYYVDSSSVATDFGTLVHFVEETIANDIKKNDNEPVFMIDMSKYVELFINGYKDDTEHVLGIKEIKEKFPETFYQADKSGMDYNEKANHYLNNGIYFLQDFLNANRNLVVLDTEKEFSITFEGVTFSGFIDRVLKDTSTGNIIVEDMKTWSTIESHGLATPLQFVIYVKAASELYDVPEDKIQCFYSLPLAVERYEAGTKNFMTRGVKKLKELLKRISEKDYTPKPSPLCAFCPFSETNPDQPEEAKNLCPYFSHWTKENRKDFTKEYEWFGMEHHAEIMEDFLRRKEKKRLREEKMNNSFKPASLPQIDVINNPEGRTFLLRRRR